MTFDEWAQVAAERAQRKAHEAGLSSERNYWQGRYVVFAAAQSESAPRRGTGAASMLLLGLALTGARGARFVAGMRDARHAVVAVQSFIEATGDKNAADWTAESAGANA